MRSKIPYAIKQAISPDPVEIVSALPLQECRARLQDNIESSLTLSTKKPLFGYLSGMRFEVRDSAQSPGRTTLRGELSRVEDKTYIRGQFATSWVHIIGIPVVAVLGGIGGIILIGTYVLTIFAIVLIAAYSLWFPFAVLNDRKYITRALETILRETGTGGSGERQ
jgi:hypothetical protein